MAAMHAVGNGRRLPSHAHVREDPDEYIVELDVPDFAEDELAVEAVGPRLTVRGDQLEKPGDDGVPFRLHEQFAESFRLPDDADPDRITVLYRSGTLQIHAPRTTLEPRAVQIERPTFLLNPDAEAC